MNLKMWQEELREILPQIRAYYRDFHQHPELSGQEVRTADIIASVLTSLGVEVTRFEGCHGLMGTLRNGEGKCVAIRADMDALPVTEASHIDCPSTVEGVMHACGHDVHMALALGSCLWLSQNRDKWSGTVKWLFEPAEETIGGGKMMVEQGCMENPHVDVVIGQHVNPNFEAGKVYTKPGYVSGASDELFITVTGRSCHGAYPEKGVDAIVIAAQIVTALQSLVSRRCSPFDPAVVTIGTISGGTANNIICGEVKMHGTIRTLSPKTREMLRYAVMETVSGIATGMGGEAEATIRPSYGAVFNHEGYHAIVESTVKELLGEDALILRQQPSLGVESFCYFVEKTPGVYYDIGCGVGTALHTPTFCASEDCLLPGIALQCANVLALLK